MVPDVLCLVCSQMVAASCRRAIAAGFARHKSKPLVMVAVGVALVLAIVSGARIGMYLERLAARQRIRNTPVLRVAARDACVARALLDWTTPAAGLHVGRRARAHTHTHTHMQHLKGQAVPPLCATVESLCER